MIDGDKRKKDAEQLYSGAAVTALPTAVAGDVPLEKRGEFRIASGAFISNLGKIKMKSTDESGVSRSIRGHITENAKPLLSAADGLIQVSMGLSVSPSNLGHSTGSVNRHGKSIRLHRDLQLVQRVRLPLQPKIELDQDGRGSMEIMMSYG